MNDKMAMRVALFAGGAAAAVGLAFGAPDASADPPDPGYTTCIENGQVNTYLSPFYPCPNMFGPSYGGGNHRWPNGQDD